MRQGPALRQPTRGNGGGSSDSGAGVGVNLNSFPFAEINAKPDFADIWSRLNRLQAEAFQFRVVLKESDGELKDIDFWQFRPSGMGTSPQIGLPRTDSRS
jgi:hypothetical protein